MAFFGLPNTPGAFPHSNYIHAGLGNARKIEIPLGLRPLLWVVNHPVKERIIGITLVHNLMVSVRTTAQLPPTAAHLRQHKA